MGCDSSEWVRAHEELLALAHEQARLEVRVGIGLLRALRAGVHRHLGFGSFAHYAEHVFGYGPRTTDDKLRTAEALEHLPELSGALDAGSVTPSAARELARVATAETEREWLEAARGRSVREVERLVAGRARGDRPQDPSRPELERHVLRFEVSAETLATFRSAMQHLREQTGESLDDDEVLLLMSRAVLAGSTGEGDGGRSSYQLAVTLCERCGESFQHAGAHDVRLEPAVAEMVQCDAQVVQNRTHVDHETARGEAQVVDETREMVRGDAPVVQSRTHVGEEAVRCDAQFVDQTHVGAERVRATQTIAPAVRRQVLIRDRRRCMVPGCRHSAYLDVHHILLRSEGGANSPQNLVALCGAHHRAVHRGQLSVTGSATAGLCFQRADGSSYCATPSAATIDLCARVFRALVEMGFRERQARSALAQLRVDETGTAQSLLRQALAHLCPPRASVL